MTVALSFMRFLGLAFRGPGSRRQDGVAVPRTLTQAGVIEALIRERPIDGYLKEGLSGDGLAPDQSTASIVAVPKQVRNSRDSLENARIKAGETPAGRGRTSLAKRRQKGHVEAAVDQGEHGKSHYGYKKAFNRRATVGTSWCGAIM